MKSLKTELEAEFIRHSPNPETIKNLKRRLSQAYYQEEIYWKIKSRNQWLSEGDQNTKFFHNCAKAHKARDRIVSVIDGDGIEHTREEAISRVAVDYFQNLFTSSASMDWEDFFEGCHSLVSEEMNRNIE